VNLLETTTGYFENHYRIHWKTHYWLCYARPYMSYISLAQCLKHSWYLCKIFAITAYHEHDTNALAAVITVNIGSRQVWHFKCISKQDCQTCVHRDMNARYGPFLPGELQCYSCIIYHGIQVWTSAWITLPISNGNSRRKDKTIEIWLPSASVVQL